MKTNRLIFIIIALFVPAFGFGSVIEEAEKAYSKGEYEKAASMFKEIMEKDGVSYSLLYNLGNTYYKLGNTGDARLCYERALKLDPGNKMIKENLNFVTDRINDLNNNEKGAGKTNIYPDEPTFFQNIYAKIAIDHNSDIWAVLAVISFILFLGGLALYIFTPVVLARKTGFFSSLIFLIFTLVFLFFSYLSARHFTSTDDAILLEYTSQLLDSPLDGAKPVTSLLHKGTKVEILERYTGNDGELWYKVRLNSENVGWVKSQFLEII